MFKKSLIFGAVSLAIATSAAASFVGFADIVNLNSDGVFHGWVCTPENPTYYGGLVKVLIYRNGRYIGRTTNFGEYRPDAAPYCGGNNYAGWNFTIPEEEFDGQVASWTATIDLEATEQPIPDGGGNATTAVLPTKSQVWYVQPYCYQTWEAPAAFSSRPGSVLGYPTAFWGFDVNVNGVAPMAPVSNWNGGVYTGTQVPDADRSSTQRGDDRSTGNEYQDTLLGRSMLQLNCTSAGFMLNNFWLDGFTNPAPQTNPAAQYGIVYGISNDRKLTISPGFQSVLNIYQPYRTSASVPLHRPFATANTSLMIAADVVVPNSYSQPTTEGPQVGQANLYVYFWDTVSGRQLAYVLGIWESRPEQTGGAVGVGFDGLAVYVAQTANYTDGPYATWEGGQWTPGTVFSQDRHYQARITRSNLLNAINEANSFYSINLSTDLGNYVLTDASVGIETFGPNYSLGASARNFSVYMTR